MRKSSLIFSALLSFCSLLPSVTRAEDEVLIKYFDIDDGRLAFTYSKEGKRTVLVLDLAELETRPLVDMRGNNESPRFSPDGEKIAYVSDRNGKKEVYVARADGSDVSRISASGSEEFDPDWSPDGKKLTFAAGNASSGSEIYIANADGSGAQAITSTKKQNKLPRWSPAGKDIVYVTNEYWPGTDLLSYNLSTKKITILTTGYASSFHPSFSRDGSLFSYVSGPAEDPDIMLVKKDAKPEAIIARAGKDVSPEWFDNGTKLWFLGESKPGHVEIFLHDVEKKEDIQLTECPGNILDLSWTPHSPKAKKNSSSSSLAPEPSPSPSDTPSAESNALGSKISGFSSAAIPPNNP